MRVLPACVCVHLISVWCPQRLKKASSGTGVMDAHGWVMGIEPHSSARAPNVLNCCPTFQGAEVVVFKSPLEVLSLFFSAFFQICPILSMSF